jgi:WD40 repeat protein
MGLACVCLLACAAAGPGAAGGDEGAPSVSFKVHISRSDGVNGPRTSPDGKLTLRVVRRLKAQVVDARTGKPAGPLLAHEGVGVRPMHINTWAFSPDGKLVATAAGDNSQRDDTAGSVRVWEVATGKLLAVPQHDVGWVHSIAFTGKRTVVIHAEELSGK